MPKAMYKSELAERAGVSMRTFSRYIASRRQTLQDMGVSPHTQLLPPNAVQYISNDYGIDL